MNKTLNSYIKSIILKNIGILPREQVQAAIDKWYIKQVLTEADVLELETALKAHYFPLNNELQ